jgi:hypothetical protein
MKGHHMNIECKGVVIGALLSGLLLVNSTSTGQADGAKQKVRETVDAVLKVLRDESLQHTSRTHSHNPLNLLSILFIGHIALKNN